MKGRLVGQAIVFCLLLHARSFAAVTADCYAKPDCTFRQPEDTITYCWVKDSYANEPSFAQVVRGYMEDFEQAAHIDFANINEGNACPAPIIDQGKEVHLANLRIMLTARGTTLTKADRGPDCAETASEDPNKLESSGNFANFPWVVEAYRGCRYNVLLRNGGDRRWVVHHEIGHALGFIHEFARADAAFGWEASTGTVCSTGIGGSAIGYVTKYDIDATSHYDRCGHIVFGLSFLDKIALQAMYPEPSSTQVDATIRHRTWLQETDASPEYKLAIRGVVAASGVLF